MKSICIGIPSETDGRALCAYLVGSGVEVANAMTWGDGAADYYDGLGVEVLQGWAYLCINMHCGRLDYIASSREELLHILKEGLV